MWEKSTQHLSTEGGDVLWGMLLSLVECTCGKLNSERRPLSIQFLLHGCRCWGHLLNCTVYGYFEDEGGGHN